MERTRPRAESQIPCGPSVGRLHASRTRALSRTGRRHDDRDWLDDRLGDFYHIGGIIAAQWRARLVASRMGYRRFANDYWRVVLLGTRDHDAARWRRLYLSARSIWEIRRVPVRLDPVSGDSNRHHRRCGDCICKISWCLCRGSFAG